MAGRPRAENIHNEYTDGVREKGFDLQFHGAIDGASTPL